LDHRFLDQQRVRGVADSTLRSYAHDLLHFIRWWADAHKTSAITQQDLTESTFLDYIRYQSDQNPPPGLRAASNRRCRPRARTPVQDHTEANMRNSAARVVLQGPGDLSQK